MLKDLVKIANRLDTLGLTKEADIIDRYISKSAGFTWQIPANLTKEQIQEVETEVDKDKNVRLFFNNLDDSFAYNMPFEILGKVSDRRMPHIYAGIRFINSYKNKEALKWWWVNEYVQFNTGSGYLNNYLDEWLSDVVEQTNKAMPENKNWKSDPKFYDLAKFLSIGGEADRAAKAVGGKGGGGGWGVPTRSSFDKTTTPQPKAPETAQTRVEVPAATPTTPAPNTPAETKPVVDPWIAYSQKVGDTRMEIKNKWLERCKVRGKDKSFSNYQAWLRSTLKVTGGVGLSVSGVIKFLDSEIGRKQRSEPTSDVAPAASGSVPPPGFIGRSDRGGL
jgi:hypothetical protein